MTSTFVFTTLSMSKILDIDAQVRTVVSMDLLDRPLALFYDGARARVLDVLFSHTGAQSGRAIARQADLSPTTVNGALAELFQSGVVSWQRKGRANLWRLKDDNSVVEQIRKIAKLQDGAAGKLVVDALGSEPVSVVLFGSAARGESGSRSDVDILVIARDRQQGQEFRRKALATSATLRKEIGRQVEITVIERDLLTKNEISGFIDNVLLDGRTLRGKKLAELVG